MSFRAFNSRSFVSAMMAFLFVFLFVSSLVMLEAPSGRIAHETGWTFLSLDKETWEDVHITFGLLFLGMAFWHLASNWKALINHIRQRGSDAAHPRFVFKREPIIALLLCLFVLLAVLV